MPRRFPEPETVTLLARRGRQLASVCQQIRPRQAWGRHELESFQTEMLLRLVRHAYDHIPFYRAKYDAAGISPLDVRTLADLRLLPFVTKDDLREADPATMVFRKPGQEVRWLATSGSTGKPARICRDEDSLWQFTARNMALYYDWCGGAPLSNGLYFLDLTPDTMDHAVADLLRTTVAEERLVSISEPVNGLVERMLDINPEFVSSYPSTMRAMAITLDRQGRYSEGLKLLHLTSEMLDGQTLMLLRRIFPRARVVETYTSTEGGLMAWSCATEGRLHVAEDSGIYEIVNPAGQPAVGTGELVLTDLTNGAMPLIRYRGLGDYGCWEEGGCSCGSIHRSLRHVEGRQADFVVTRRGALISPFLITNAMDEVGGIVQYQIIQESVGEFEILVVRRVGSKVSESDIQAAMMNCLSHVLRESTACRIRYVDQIKPKPGSHKVPLVVSRIGKDS